MKRKLGPLRLSTRRAIPYWLVRILFDENIPVDLTAPMRLLAWNINHRARPKPVPRLMVEALAALKPDVAVLTEYVPGPSHPEFLGALASIGISYVKVSRYVVSENSVLIASRCPIETGPVKAPAIDRSLPSNVLHVTTDALDILGLRVPDYSKQPAVKRRCWDWILQTASNLKSRPAIMLGDFNTAPDYPRARCGDRIGMLVDHGWQHAAPPDGASYWTLRGHGVRIDHAFVTDHFTVLGSMYVREFASYHFAGKQGQALSDHAALVVDIVPSSTFGGEGTG